MKRSHPVILYSLLGCLLSTMSYAQDPSNPQAKFGELVEVSEVLLDVLVTNQDGDVVVGLEPSDFIVIDEGQERNVTGADFYSNRFLLRDDAPKNRVQKPAPGEVPSDRFFILFFHDTRRLGDVANRLFRQQARAAKHAKRWVEEEMLQGDWVAVLSYDVKLKVHSDFTRDREQLLKAITSSATGKDPGNQWASRRPEAGEQKPTLLTHLPEGKQLRDESKNIYDGLSLVAEATRDILGRKNVMMFTIGFGDLRTNAGGSAFLEGGIVSRPDERFYPGLKESLNDNNVAIYPIDLTPTEWEHAQRDFLNVLAVDTGGVYHFNFVSFLSPMRQIADEANGYYLLSYLAEHPSGEHGYRDVKIKTRNPELKVRARTGYRFGT